jgi:hypothetical protein
MSAPLASLLGDLASLGVDEKRRVEDDYVELVGRQKSWEEWSLRLSAALGPASKPAGQKPTSEQERAAERWGGIRKQQVLFQGRVDGSEVVALIWPWEGGERFTLKMGRVP